MKTVVSGIRALAGLGCGLGAALAAAPPKPPAALRTISLADATCNTIPGIPPVTLAIPGDYVTRAPASRKPGLGCLWGSAADLDRAMKDPKGVDFSAIREGVFWARPASNVGYNAAKKQFFDSRGSDEAAMKREFEATGVKNAVMQRRNVGPYPTLEFTGDLPAGTNHKAGRISRIYIGLGSGTRTLLVYFHPPARSSPAGDQTWSQFVSSLRTTAR